MKECVGFTWHRIYFIMSEGLSFEDSLPLSLSHCPNMTKILLKRMTNHKSFIHSFDVLQVWCYFRKCFMTIYLFHEIMNHTLPLIGQVLPLLMGYWFLFADEL